MTGLNTNYLPWICKFIVIFILSEIVKLANKNIYGFIALGPVASLLATQSLYPAKCIFFGQKEISLHLIAIEAVNHQF